METLWTVPARLLRPWDSPGKNTGARLQCMKVKSESEVAQSRPTLSDPKDCSPQSSSIHGIFQSRVLVSGAIAFSAMSRKQSLGLTEKLPPLTAGRMCFDFYVGPRTRHRWHRLSELWLVNATLSCKVGKAPLPLSPPPPQRNDGPRDRTWPRPQEARGWPPTHWHTHRFLAV